MKIDAAAITAVVSEMQSAFVGAHIESVIAPTPDSIALQIFAQRKTSWLTISAHSRFARIAASRAKPAKILPDPSAFVMLLRKYLEGARITSVNQPEWERIVAIHTMRSGEDETILIAEIMGQASNAILINSQNMILGALRQVSLEVNHYRAIQPNKEYISPPPQTFTAGGEVHPKYYPEQARAEDILAYAATVSSTEPMSAAKIVTAIYAGVSPDLAKGIVFQSVGDTGQNIALSAPEAPDICRAIAMEIRRMAEKTRQRAWNMAGSYNERHILTDAAIFPEYTSLHGATQPLHSANELIAEYFGAKEWHSALDSARAPLRKTLHTAVDRLKRKLGALQEEQLSYAAADTLRLEGDMLLSFANEIPEHARSFIVPDFGGGNAAITIQLDPQYSAVENAERRFAKYHKMRRGAALLPQQIADTQAELEYISQLQTDLELAESLDDIYQVKEMIVAARQGYNLQNGKTKLLADKARKKSSGKKSQNPKKNQKKSMNILQVKSSGGFAIYVGKNSAQNEYVTFEIGSGSDIWLHARGVPGAHVIIKSAGKEPDGETIQYAASLAAWFSQSRGAPYIPVDYTQQRYVRRMKNSGPGMVIYERERTIQATPRREPHLPNGSAS